MENDGDLPEVARGKRTDAQNSEVLNDLKYTNSLARYRLGTFEDMFGDKERSLEHDKDCHKLRTELQESAPSYKHSNMLMVAAARAGKWEQASQMATDKANAEKKPDGAQWIRIARAYAMCSLVDGSPQIEMLNKSIDAVEKAVAEGFTDWPDMLSEPDLIAIHDDPRFLTIVQGIKSDTQSANTK